MAGSLVSVVDAIHQGSKEALALIDGRNRVHLIQDGAPVTRLLGMPPRRIVQDPLSIIHPDDIDAVQQTFLATRRVAEASTSVHFRAMGERGEVALVATFTNYLERRELRALVVRVRQDEAVPMSSPPPSVRSSATSNVDIIPDVWLDAGLVTMTQLLDATDQAVQRHREGSLRGFSMLLVEVNNYRRIQNAFSHEVVEELVVQIHGRFRPLLGDRDQVAVRNDGLFAILLLGIGDGVKAERLGEKFLRAVQAPFNVDDAVLKVEPMVGLATSERTYTNGEAVFRDASSAIGSAAKTKGRRKLAAFRTQIRSDERDQITLLAEMSRGLEADEFRCVYQPIVDLKSRALTGFEALVRWRHPSRGELGPGVFINLAEETGFIEALGEWVLRSSCRQMAQWYRAYPNARGLSVSVNVSGVQLGNPQL
ncbi:MAG: EAL domain-containing protein, partial [Myxococcota bacterium]